MKHGRGPMHFRQTLERALKFDNKWQQLGPRPAYIVTMRRVVRRTDTVVTIQTWTVTWTEDVPAHEPAPATPAALPGPAPEIAPETPPALPDSSGSAE